MNTATATPVTTTTRRPGARQPGRVLPAADHPDGSGDEGLASGQTLLVVASDPGFEPDIEAWSSRTGNALLSSERQGNEIHVLLRKA